MKTKASDMAKWNEGMKALEAMWEEIIAHPTSKAEKMYFQLEQKYYEGHKRALEEGKDIVAFPPGIPAEILYAMDAFPFIFVYGVCQMFSIAGNYQESFDAGAEAGLMRETCSALLGKAGWYHRGWVPPLTAIVHGAGGCDIWSGVDGLGAELIGCPSYCVDLPYYTDEKGIDYMAREYLGMISFLEERTNRKMDWDKLEEIVEKSAKIVKLNREIDELRKAVPAPMDGWIAWYIHLFNWKYAGTEDGISWFETLRDELKERVQKRIGVAPEEKFRLMDLFFPPFFVTDLAKKWQKEQGAVFVHEPFSTYNWNEWDGEMDPSDPLKSLAKKYLCGPFWGVLNGPVERWCDWAVRAAIEWKVDGAVWWAQKACAHTSFFRFLKDVLSEKLNLSTLVIDVDICDPTFVSEEEIEERYEEFFERLERQRRS